MKGLAPLSAVLAQARARLAAAGFDTPALEARLLVEAATGLSPERQILDGARPLDGGEAERLASLVERRLAHEPIAHLLGEREFWSMRFAVSPATLVPRPDSETVVTAALSCVADRCAPLRLLDLGTGTGCLLLALLRELPCAEGVGVDIVPAAAALARANAERLGLADRARFLVADWASALAGPFDLVLANPPYVESAALTSLERQVRDHEPGTALDGGPDGLDAYRALLPQVAGLLAAEGRLVVEIGVGQKAAVESLGRCEGLDTRAVHEDFGGRARALVFGPASFGRRAAGCNAKKGVGNPKTTG
ncbi:MAG: peptide chain release factor N(5)-glutamine methyltransferase [Alphaproteobacteria bacterium]|nr:peptide chain release factor N(5)-glutamine methyltransferase [Alphaproteobacteria bacterium]